MAEESEQQLQIDDLEDPEHYKVEVNIRHGRAKTANLLAIILIGGLVAALPLYVTVVLFSSAAAEKLAAVFDKWFTVVGPLAGAAMGAYYGRRDREKEGVA